MPQPDSCTAETATLFDHLVGAGEKRRRDFNTKRFRGLEIDGKQKFGGLLNRKLGRFGAFENSIDIVGAAPRQGGDSQGRKKLIRRLAQAARTK